MISLKKEHLHSEGSRIWPVMHGAQSEDADLQPGQKGAICKGREDKLLAIFEERDRIHAKSKGLVLCFCTYVLQLFSSQEDKVSGPRAPGGGGGERTIAVSSK